MDLPIILNPESIKVAGVAVRPKGDKSIENNERKNMFYDTRTRLMIPFHA